MFPDFLRTVPWGAGLVAPTMFYRWQEALFANAALALEKKSRPKRNKEHEKIEKLESQIRVKDATMAEWLW